MNEKELRRRLINGYVLNKWSGAVPSNYFISKPGDLENWTYHYHDREPIPFLKIYQEN